MKFEPKNPPREFTVGQNDEIVLKDYGRIHLDRDEQVTFITESHSELDVVRKSWGFYATPSLNKRLRRFNLRAVLAKGADGDTFFLLLVEQSKEHEFHSYLQRTGMSIVCWLDSDEALHNLEQRLNASKF